MKIIIILLMMLLLIATVSAEQLSYDGFESGTFCGGGGWNQSCWDISGSTAIRGWTSPYEGNRHAWMRSNNGVLSRNVSISGYSDLNVSFAYKVNSFEGGDTATFNIIIDGGAPINIETWDSSDSDNTWHYITYDLSSYNGNILRLDFRSLMSDLGDELNLDVISVGGGVGQTHELFIIMDNNYPKGMQNIQIDLSSSESSTLHTLNLTYSNGTQFCYKQLQSPSIPYTTFTTYCNMPDKVAIDNKAYFYVTNDESINISKYFNIVELDNNPDELNIESVYYSQQVLQGSSTEIFGIIDGYFNTSKLYLKFPDNDTRILNMQPTGNNKEYRAFITDTFDTGNINFTLRVESSAYYDEYASYYMVVPYTLDFVDIVNRVSEVLNVQNVQNVNETVIQVHGTEYSANKPGKVFLQMLDGEDDPINDSTCYTSIYYPNNNIWKYQQFMSHIGEGLYVYDFTTPYTAGVYPVSAFCTVPGLNISDEIVEDNFNSGSTSGGSGWNNDWDLDGCYYDSGNVHEGAYAVECANDRVPYRNFNSTTGYESLNYEFWWRADSIEAGEYVYYRIRDASDTIFTLKTITDGDDDGTYYQVTGTLYDDVDGFDFDGELEFYIETSGNLEAGDYYNIDTLEIGLVAQLPLNDSNYQILRGTGEVHITSDKNYIATLSNGEMKNGNGHGTFTFHFDIISQVAENKTGQAVNLPLWGPFPCNQVYNVTILLDNGSKELQEWHGQSDDAGRCVVAAEIDLAVGETYDLEVLTNNYWKPELYQAHDTLLLEQEMINISCQNYILTNNLTPLTIPTTGPVNNSDALWASCSGYLDAAYYFTSLTGQFYYFSTLTYNFSLDEMETLEQDWLQMQKAKTRASEYANTVFNGLNLGNSYSLGLISDPQPPTNPLYVKYFASISTSYLNYGSIQALPTSTWNFENRTLTEFDFEVNATANINTTAVANDVWARPDRTLTNVSNIAIEVWGTNRTIDSGLLGQFTSRIWNYIARYTHGIEI